MVLRQADQRVGPWQNLKRRFGASYFMPNIRPSLFRLPDLVVGTPVNFAILRFALVTPKARFQLKDRPGILNDLRLAIKNNHLSKDGHILCQFFGKFNPKVEQGAPVLFHFGLFLVPLGGARGAPGRFNPLKFVPLVPLFWGLVPLSYNPITIDITIFFIISGTDGTNGTRIL